MTLDYQYIDPGPDDPGCTKNRYFALNVSGFGFLNYELNMHFTIISRNYSILCTERGVRYTCICQSDCLKSTFIVCFGLDQFL